MIFLAYFFIRVLVGGDVMVSKENEIIHTSLVRTEWVCVKEDKDISLFERWVKVNDELNVRERMGQMVVECNINEASEYLGDYKTAQNWIKGVKESCLKNDIEEDLVYMVIGLPWPFANRDFFAKYSFFDTGDGQVVIRVESKYPQQKLNPKCVRIRNYSASWVLRKIDEEKTKIIFTTFSSEPPMFPQWMQEPVLKKVFYNNLKRLSRELSS